MKAVFAGDAADHLKRFVEMRQGAGGAGGSDDERHARVERAEEHEGEIAAGDRGAVARLPEPR